MQQRLLPAKEQEMLAVQAGFGKGRDTQYLTANSCWTLEHSIEFQKKVSLCFADYSKAFDWVDYEKLWVVLREKGRGHSTWLSWYINCIVDRKPLSVYGEREWCPIGKGVRQGCILYSCLFNLYLEHIIWKTRLDSEEGRVKIGERNRYFLGYAEGAVYWQKVARIWKDICGQWDICRRLLGILAGGFSFIIPSVVFHLLHLHFPRTKATLYVW